MRGTYAFSTGIVVLAKLSGFVRGVLLASYLGTSIALDVYNGMLVIAGAVVFIAADQFELLVSAETAREYKREPETFRTYVIGAVSVAAGVGVVLGTLAAILMPLIVGYMVPAARGGVDVSRLAVAGALLPLVMVQIPSRVMAALLRGSGRAVLSMLLDGMNGLLFLAFVFIGLLALAGRGDGRGVMAVALAQSAASLLVFLVQFGAIRGQVGRSPLCLRSLWRAPEFGRRLSVISGLSGLSYGFTLVDRHFAAKAVAGGLSLVNYAGNISLTLRSALAYEHLFVVEFSTSQDRNQSYASAVKTCLWMTAPMSGMLPVFAYDLVRVVFQRGQFTPQMARLTADVLAVYGGFTTGFLLWQLLFRILQVEGRLRPLFRVSGLALVVSVGLTPFAVRAWGLAGAICGTVAGTVVLLIGGAYLLHRSGRRVLPLRRIALALALMLYGLAAAFVAHRWLGGGSVWQVLAVCAIGGIIAYIPTAFWWLSALRRARRI